LQQPSHKIFDFVAYIDWFQGVKRPGMAVFDRQNQYSRDCRMQMRQSHFISFFHHLIKNPHPHKCKFIQNTYCIFSKNIIQYILCIIMPAQAEKTVKENGK
ncbi:MAG: hypothetical protein IJA85_11600, partial [Clostridia bacterium]|nr:hypothetical protein [Clostridia bacterium]